MIAKRVGVEATAAQSTSPCHIETSIPGTLVAAAAAGGAGTAMRIAANTVTARDSEPACVHARWAACTHPRCAHEDNHTAVTTNERR